MLVAEREEEPLNTDRAVLMAAGIALANDRVLSAVIELLHRKNLLDPDEIDGLMREPVFSNETSARSAAFYRGVKD